MLKRFPAIFGLKGPPMLEFLIFTKLISQHRNPL